MTRTLSPVSLLYSIVAGPILWFVHFVLVYMVADFGCRANFTNVVYLTPDTIRTIILIITIVILLAVAVGGLLAYRNWQALPQGENSGTLDHVQARFLIMMGALLTALFFLSIIASAAPTFFLSVCDRAA